MGLFSKKVTSKNCPECNQNIPIHHPDYSYGFTCPECEAKLYWNSISKTLEANTPTAWQESENKLKGKIEELEKENRILRETSKSYLNEIEKYKEKQQNKENPKNIALYALILIILMIATVLIFELPSYFR